VLIVGCADMLIFDVLIIRCADYSMC